MVENLNRLAIVNNNFVHLYIEYLKFICSNNHVRIDVYDENSSMNIDFAAYDYVITDVLPIKGGVKVFHQHSVEYQMDKAENFVYKILYRLTHSNKIKEQYECNVSYPKLVCVSSEVKRDLEKYYKIPPEKLIVAHAGFIPPAQSNDDKHFKKLEENEIFTICTSAVGFVTKGGYTLLRAIRKFRKMYPEVKIKANIIYPKYEKNLAVKLYVKLFGLSDAVEFFGYQNDINEFYNKAHCLTCQSVYEAFGRIVTEAMYQKIPVIVGSNIGAADIVEDGVSGFIFEDGKNAPENLAKKIKEVYDKYNELEPFVEKAYQTSKSLTWENFAKELFYGLYPEFKK